MAPATRGVLAVIIACTIWGLSPLYYGLFDTLSPLEIISHRTLWSVVVFGIIIALRRRGGDLIRTVRSPRKIMMLLIAGLVVGLNWYLYIWSIEVGRVIESSLGYYIFPFVMVFLGFVVFGEGLRPLQWIAVLLALIGVCTLTWGLGVAPWLALILAVTFAAYGLIKRLINIDPLISVTGEVLLLLPIAVGVLIYIGHWPDLKTTLLISLSGPFTAGPLILLSYAAQQIKMATIGVLQYINPSLQFICAVVIMGEAMTPWHMIAFGCIWVAVVLYSLAAFRKSVSTSSIEGAT